MSIIYDALKKVEGQGIKQNAPKNIKSPQAKSGFKNALIYILIIVAAIFGMNLFFKLISAPRAESGKPAIAKPVLQTEAKPAAENKSALPPAGETPGPSKFALTGVFYSGDEAYALINNQITKVGDVVSGASVKRITLEGVELEENGKPFQIPNKQ